MATKDQKPEVTETKQPSVLYRYLGPDEFPGIPAHDLTQDDFDRLPILRQLDVKASGSYEAAETFDLASLTNDELKARATALNVEGLTSMTKDDLVSAIEAAETEGKK